VLQAATLARGVLGAVLAAAALRAAVLGASVLGCATRGAAVVGRNREPVIRVRPQACLAGILAGRLDLRRQRGKLVAATLADNREGLPVQHQPERDLIRPARLVMTRDRRHAQQRSIYAA
jgi:hypothetical protein